HLRPEGGSDLQEIAVERADAKGVQALDSSREQVAAFLPRQSFCADGGGQLLALGVVGSRGGQPKQHAVENLASSLSRERCSQDVIGPRAGGEQANKSHGKLVGFARTGAGANDDVREFGLSAHAASPSAPLGAAPIRRS